MTPRTRLFFFSHVLSPTGLVLPARELCAAARRRGVLTVVDGAHAPALLPLDLDAIGADFYGAQLPQVAARPDRLRLPRTSAPAPRTACSRCTSAGAGTARPDAARTSATSSARRRGLRLLEFEGTRDLCPWLAVPAAIDFQAALGWDAVRRRIAELAAYARKAMPLAPATPDGPGLSGALTAFGLAGPVGRAKELRERIWSRRVEMPVIERPGRLLVRRERTTSTRPRPRSTARPRST